MCPAFAGHVSPLAVLVTGLAMFFVATGYASLNRWRAHAGAPYVWVGEAISPSVGAGTGFLNVAVSTFANVGNITLAGAYLLFVLFPTHTFSKPVTWLVATAIMGVLVYLSIRGIRPSVWVQTAFIVIEYSAMISFVVLALIHESSGAGGAIRRPRTPDAVGRAAHPRRDPAAAPDPVPGERVGEHGDRLRHQRGRDVRPVHVLRDRGSAASGSTAPTCAEAC
jgi:hypothetical protein